MKTSILRFIALLVLLPLLARGQFNGGGSFNPGPTSVPVTKITAGAGISLSPSTGTGTVQITATGTAPSIAAYSVLSNSTSGAATAVGNTTLVVGAPTPSVTSNGGVLISSFALTSAQQGNLYAEFAIQGQNAGAAASTDYIAYADNSTSTTHFVDVGINSSGYAAGGTAIFPFVANAAYVFSGSDDLYVGTGGSNTLHLFTNSVDRITITGPGVVTFSAGAVFTGAITGITTLNASSTITGGNFVLGSGNILQWNGRNIIQSTADGTILLSDSTQALGVLLQGVNTITSIAAMGITGGTGNMTITAGTGNSRTMILRTTTSGGTATTFLTGNADQSATFAGALAITGALTGATTGNFSGNLTSQNALSVGSTAYSFGALPSGATTSGPVITVSPTTYTVTGTNTATAFQANYFGVPTFTDASVGTVTDLFNSNFVGPAVVAGSLLGTRKHTVGVLDATSASSSIIGGFVVAATYGTTATSTAIGGGNINTGGTLTVGGVSTLTGNVTLTAKVTSYNGVATAGWGVPAIQNVGRVTAQSAANASIATYTCGAADGTFDVSANMNVTVNTALVTTLTCTYTDESNTARTMILPVQQLSGSFIAAGAITGLGAWETPVMHIRVKASTAITILTSAGTFTGVTYTAEGRIIQTG